MTGQSGFLNSFLKFLEGDESEQINKPAATRRRSLASKKEEETPPGKVKRPRGRPRKNPILKVIDDKSNCESEDILLEKKNDSEALVDSDSQSTNNSNMLQVLRENFNKCSNEKVECAETTNVEEVSEKKECENEGKKQNGERLSEMKEDNLEENKVNFSPKSQKRKNSVDESSNCSEKVISNLTDQDESVSQDSAAKIATKRRAGRGRKKGRTDVQERTPQREQSARRAKRKVKFSYIESESEDNPDFDESNSDNDPVWTPDEKKASSDEEDNFAWKQRQNLLLKARKNSTPSKNLPRNVEKTNVQKIDSASSGTEQKSAVGVESEKKPTVEPKTTASVNYRRNSATRCENNQYADISETLVPFQSGSFIALREELEDSEEPTLWRVDGKALLQKYEAFRSEDGALRYRNVSTYSGWGPKHRNLYDPVPVRFIYQNRFEYIVEIIKEELIINEDKLRERLVKDLNKYSLSYEVYLQTLVSQALDSNFLNEIVTERDDYFLSSLNKIDGVCTEKGNKLLRGFNWNEVLQENLSKWPILNIDPKAENHPEATCQVCCNDSYDFSVNFGGDSYCNQTLECLSTISESEEFKIFLACRTCLERLQLYNQIAHLKYHTYQMCIDLVREKQANSENIDNTRILHDILADSPFINKKFHEVALLWAEADLKSRKKKIEEIRLT